MKEQAERKAYREKCQYYGIDGHCSRQSMVKHCTFAGAEYSMVINIEISCTPTSECRRMKMYDKRHKA